MVRILLVEDDSSIVASLTEFLENEGYIVTAVSGERDALKIIEKSNADILLLDISLSDGNGFNVCKGAKDSGLPVIFLTAQGEENNVVRGLDMGADDYISKPFRPRELLSRIKSVLRRYNVTGSVVELGDVLVDTDKGIVKKAGEQIDLSPMEYRLLMTFINNRGILLSRNKLLEDIWDIGGDFVNDNTLTVYIKRLRAKIEDDPQDPVIIKTVRGLGYRMD